MSLSIFENPRPTPVHFIRSFADDVELYLQREDLIHPTIAGNKYRKLKYNFREAVASGNDTVLTFGGAFSNHLHATAAAGAACGLKTVGVVRGEIHEPLNSTLDRAMEWGMELLSVSRSEYRNKTDTGFLAALKQRFGNFYLIPEGGSNVLAMKGCKEITEVGEEFDYWCVSCGTGGTMAGILSGLGSAPTLLGFPALKGGDFLKHDINKLLRQARVEVNTPWSLISNYHFGGYAKINGELIDFIRHFKDTYGIQLDPIYTGKLLYGLFEMANRGFFPAKSRILAIHTGGYQGITGIEKKYGIELK